MRGITHNPAKHAISLYAIIFDYCMHCDDMLLVEQWERNKVEPTNRIDGTLGGSLLENTWC